MSKHRTSVFTSWWKTIFFQTWRLQKYNKCWKFNYVYFSCCIKLSLFHLLNLPTVKEIWDSGMIALFRCLKTNFQRNFCEPHSGSILVKQKYLLYWKIYWTVKRKCYFKITWGNWTYNFNYILNVIFIFVYMHM